MKSPFGVLLTYPMDAYLEEEISRRFDLFRLWEHLPECRIAFLRSNSGVIRAVVGNTFAGVDSQMIDALPALEIVASFSVGLDMVDCRRCAERGIRITNTPDVLTDDVADLAIALAIAALRRMCAAERHVRSGAWISDGDYRLCSKFSGKAVGIIGLGRIGSAVARRAEAFGCPIGYHSRTEKPETGYKCFSSVVDLAAESQVLIASCPLKDETRRIIGRDVINALGPQGVLINIGRGALVDEAELVRALIEGRLGGAGLDVFEREPEVPQQLTRLDNVVLLPHVGSGTRETSRAMADLVLANLEAHVQGKPLLTPVV